MISLHCSVKASSFMADRLPWATLFLGVPLRLRQDKLLPFPEADRDDFWSSPPAKTSRPKKCDRPPKVALFRRWNCTKMCRTGWNTCAGQVWRGRLLRTQTRSHTASWAGECSPATAGTRGSARCGRRRRCCGRSGRQTCAQIPAIPVQPTLGIPAKHANKSFQRLTLTSLLPREPLQFYNPKKKLICRGRNLLNKAFWNWLIFVSARWRIFAWIIVINP